jgi:hypothetical protein
MLRRLSVSMLAFIAIAAGTHDAFAAPARIVVLRHGEKADAYRLCGVGVQRSRASGTERGANSEQGWA